MRMTERSICYRVSNFQAKGGVSSPIARLDKEFNLEETIDSGVSGSGRGVIPEELEGTRCSSSVAIASGLLHLCPDVETIARTDGQSAMAIELEDGLRKRLKVESNLFALQAREGCRSNRATGLAAAWTTSPAWPGNAGHYTTGNRL